jgi:hypothetical protein
LNRLPLTRKETPCPLRLNAYHPNPPSANNPIKNAGGGGETLSMIDTIGMVTLYYRH